MIKIKIGKRIISEKDEPLIVAEIGINHFGSLALAKKIVIAAKKSGVEAIKVQIHIPEEEMSEEELELYKQKVKTMEWLWGPDETRTVLGHLKGMKEKKEKQDE